MMSELTDLETAMKEKLTLYKEGLADYNELKAAIKAADVAIKEDYIKRLYGLSVVNISSMDSQDGQLLIAMGRTNFLSTYLDGQNSTYLGYRISGGLSGKELQEARIVRDLPRYILFSDVDSHSRMVSGTSIATNEDWSRRLQAFVLAGVLAERQNTACLQNIKNRSAIYKGLDPEVYGTYDNPRTSMRGLRAQYADVLNSIFPREFRAKNGNHMQNIKTTEMWRLLSAFSSYDRNTRNHSITFRVNSMQEAELAVFHLIRKKYNQRELQRKENSTIGKGEQQKSYSSSANPISRLFLEPVEIRKDADICNAVFQLECKAQVGFLPVPIQSKVSKAVNATDSLLGIKVRSDRNGYGEICNVNIIQKENIAYRTILKIQFETIAGQTYEAYDVTSVLSNPMLHFTEKGSNLIRKYIAETTEESDPQWQKQYTHNADSFSDKEKQLRKQIDELKSNILQQKAQEKLRLEKKRQAEHPNFTSKFNTSKDILYVHGGDIKCERERHDIEAIIVELTNRDGEPIKINANFCWDCGLFFIHHTEYGWYKKKYRLNRLSLAFKRWKKEPESEQRNYSPLSLNDYSVGAEAGYSDEMRKMILTRILTETGISKPEVMRYLRKFIDRNGKKKGNEIAKAKWEQDLAFVRDFKLNEQMQAGKKKPQQWT